MNSKWTVIYTCTLLAFCESAFVDSLHPCAIDDSSCLENLIQSILRISSKTGIEDYKIKAFDPIDIKNTQIPILGLVNIKLEEGEARGIKNCVIGNIVVEVQNGHLVLDITCDLNVKAKFKLEEISPLVQKSLGSNSLEGSGDAKINLDKLHIKFEFFFDVIKKEDGEIYFKCKPEKTLYEFEIGKAKFVADKLLLGDQEFTKEINEYMDKNLIFVLKTFGKHFFDVAVDILSNILHIFFDKTPSKYFISSDLTPYLKTVSI